MKRYIILFAVMALTVGILAAPASAGSGNQQLKINVLLNTSIDDGILAELGSYGRVTGELYEIDAVFMKARAKDLDAIRSLPFVAAANPDAERTGAPIDTVEAKDFSNGLNTWDLDAINVTDFELCTDPVDPEQKVLCGTRTIDYDGSGVYVAVLDTGLLDSWRQYFPEQRIATEFAKSFGGGGGERGHVSEQPNKWEHDQNSHGTHVTSTILGYYYRGRADSFPINGVAPEAMVIPVKVLNQNGSGWSSTVAAGITYIGDLKAHRLADHPVVINMSLGGPELDAVEQAAIDHAIDQGVIIVASAGNEGEHGMGYPGAYPPVISVAASGFTGEWIVGSAISGAWWRTDNVADPTDVSEHYIAEFSSRSLNQCDETGRTPACQDLDVAAPGSWVVGPYQVNSGQLDYYFLGGTSMASPHVAGIVALMAQKNPTLMADEAEMILEDTAISLGSRHQCRSVFDIVAFQLEDVCWDASDAEGAGLVQADLALAATTSTAP